MNIRLGSLTISGFRSYEKTTQISFPSNGLLLISGASGSGKSTIPLALSYVCGTCPYPATELQSWFTDEPMSVTAEFDIDGQKVSVTRGHKPSVVIDDKTVATAASKITEKLQQLTKLSPELLDTLTYRGQRERGLFLSKTDSVKKEFLAEVLGLNAIERAVATAQDNIKKLEIEREVRKRSLDVERGKVIAVPEAPPDLSSEIENLRGFLAASDAEIAKKTLAIKEIEASRKAQYAPEIAQLKDTIYVRAESEETKKLSVLAAEAQRRIDARVAEEDKKMAAVRAKTAMASAAYHECLDAAKELRTIQQTLSEKQQTLSSTHCPTCHQAWVPNRAELEEQIRQLTQRGDDLTELASQGASRKQELDSAGEHEPDMMVAQLLQVRAAIQERLEEARKNVRQAASARLDAIHEEGRQAISKAQEELRLATEMRETFHNEIFQHERKQAEYTNWLRLREEAAKILANIVALEKSVHETECAIALEQEFIKLAGREGFLGSIFDEVLAEVAAEANAILAKVPNVKHVTIRFVSEVTTQKNTTKKNIVPIVSVDGHEATLSPSLASLSAALSGGMATSVELAVDLAVSTVISRRSGVNPQYLILDESFDGLGPNEKEMALEILRQHASDKLIIVVDHMPEFKEFFEKSIFVSSVAGRSVLTDERH